MSFIERAVIAIAASMMTTGGYGDNRTVARLAWDAAESLDFEREQRQNGAGETDIDGALERQNNILAAVSRLVAAGEQAALTAAGAPKVEALEALLGYEINAGERDAAWAAYQEMQAPE